MQYTTTLRRAFLLRKIAGLEEKRALFLKKFPSIDPATIDRLSEADPTAPSYQFLEWLVRRNQKGELRGENLAEIRNLLNSFNYVKSYPFLVKAHGLNNTDINQYSLRDLRELFQQSGWVKKLMHADWLPRGCTLVYSGQFGPLSWAVIRIGGPGVDLAQARDAATDYGEDTEWCTAHDHFAERYLEKGPLFVVFQNGEKYAQTDGKNEIKDVYNREIPFQVDSVLWRLLFKLKIIDPARFFENAGSFGRLTEEEEREYQKHPVDYFHYLFDKRPKTTPEKWKEVENCFLRSPEAAYLYVSEVKKSRWPEGESVIAKDPVYALWYAENVLNGPFPLGEKAIARNSQSALSYASLIQKPFPKGEKAISQKYTYSYWYARDILEARFPLGEPAIKKDPFLWERYCAVFGINPDS